MSRMKPENGDRILLFKHESAIQMILEGRKKMEIRGRHYRAGKFLLGHKGVIHGAVKLGPAVLIQSHLAFERYRPRHQYEIGPRDKLPYKTTFGMPILDVEKLNVPFRHPQGAISIVKYRP